MQILYYFRNEGTFMFTWQLEHIVAELERHDCHVEIINPLDYESTEQANEAVLKAAMSDRYALFMTCLNEKYLFNETLLQIKKIGIPTLLFCPDNLLAPFNFEHSAMLYDLVWLTSKETEYLYKKWSCNTVFLPYAANPYLFIPVYKGEIPSAGFIGNPHGSRVDRINSLTTHDINVVVHNRKREGSVKPCAVKAQPVFTKRQNIKNFMRYPIGRKILFASAIDKLAKHEFVQNEFLHFDLQVPFDQMAEVMCKYAFMLSFSDAKSTGVLRNPVPIINLRQFEIPMAGGLQFTTYTDELSQYFENDHEIVMCRSKEEYIEKAKFYLRAENEELRMKMKIAARKRAEAEHTWFGRFQIVFDRLGLGRGSE